jgi:hypothetical protein
MSIKNITHKSLTQKLQRLRNAKKEFDDFYSKTLSVEEFNNEINNIINIERVKDTKKLSRIYKFPSDEAIKKLMQGKTDEEIAFLTSVNENEVIEDEIKKKEAPIFTKITVNKKKVFINEKDNDNNIYDESMRIIGEIKIEKKFTLFDETKLKN